MCRRDRVIFILCGTKRETTEITISLFVGRVRCVKERDGGGHLETNGKKPPAGGNKKRWGGGEAGRKGNGEGARQGGREAAERPHPQTVGDAGHGGNPSVDTGTRQLSASWPHLNATD